MRLSPKKVKDKKNPVLIPLGDIAKHSMLCFLKCFHSEPKSRKEVTTQTPRVDNLLKVKITDIQETGYRSNFFPTLQPELLKLLYQVRLERAAVSWLLVPQVCPLSHPTYLV